MSITTSTTILMPLAKSRLVKELLRAGLFCIAVLASVSFFPGASQAAQSKLPACEGEYKITKSWLFGDGPDEKWTNCFGKMVVENDYYLGEFKAGLPDGQGIYKWESGVIYIGQWKRNRPSGLGVQLDPEGNILALGVWNNNKLVQTQTIDLSIFDNRITSIAFVNNTSFLRRDWEKQWKNFYAKPSLQPDNDVFKCVKFGFSHKGLVDEAEVYPLALPEERVVNTILQKCEIFVQKNQNQFQKFLEPSFDCVINSIRSECVLVAERPDNRGTFSAAQINLYELAFADYSWKFSLKETENGKLERAKIEEKQMQLALEKEREKKEAERRRAEQREVERKVEEEERQRMLRDPAYQRRLAEEERENKKRLAEKDRELSGMSFTTVVACLDPYGQGMDQTLAMVLMGHLIDGCLQCFAKLLTGSASRYCQDTDTKLTDLNLLRKLRKVGSSNNLNYYTVKSTGMATLGVVGRK
jgi:hypothetical protein